ncbi:hypothetical protein [Qipengyuania nanhaisediminis]|uniref:hypothetical protein n=1 Tax=Qipengyuania nanhaisediminis TaxID=604088 RepID=UPI0038B24E34
MKGELRMDAAGPRSSTWTPMAMAAFAALAIGLTAGLQLFYTHVYSVHTDLAGILLSSSLALELGEAFSDYIAYFPPAEQAWFSLPVLMSQWTGLRLDLASMMLTGASLLFSVGFAYHIRRRTVGAGIGFMAGSLALLIIVPILYKNVVGLREHMVVLGLWPYLVLRVSDPEGRVIGWKTRALLGLWMGATLSLKYLYSLVVLLVELVDAAVQRHVWLLFRIENLIAGGIVGTYVLFWLILDPAQREVMAAVVSAIDANLAGPIVSLKQAAIHASLAIFYLLLAYFYKLPLRTSLIGLALVSGAVIAAWIQARWYSHHLFPITVAYMAWLWMIHREIKLLWIIALCVLFVRPLAGEFRNTAPYQISVNELTEAMQGSGLSVEGKKVGLLAMHPSPFNQFLASHGAQRWITSMNNSYVASALKPLDVPANDGKLAPAITLDEPGRAMLHDAMLVLWEDMPPEVLILDHSTSWPLRHVEVEWERVFAEDERFQAILSQYRPVFEHEGEWVAFTYLVRKDAADPAR